MALEVVGAGVGRTGTESLKVALEQLLQAPCYHMLEVLQHPEWSRYWAAAGRGDTPDWEEVFAGFAACVDWPAAAYWPEISEAYPEAVVILSTRASAQEWYESAASTIFAIDPATVLQDSHEEFIPAVFGRFTPDIYDPAAAMAAYEAHNRRVREAVPAGRLLEWQPGDGWEPICQALATAVPDEPFPHLNTRQVFQQRLTERAEP
jgi:hypothetical protein